MIAGVSIAGLVCASVTACTASPPPPQWDYGAVAFGSYVTAAGTANSGRTFAADLGCTMKPGLNAGNTGAGVDLAPFGSLGALTSHATTTGGSTISSAATENIAAINLLNGAITADSVTLSSTTTHSAAGFSVSGSAQFVNLRVLGIAQPANLPVSKSFTLPGIGTVNFNVQGSRVTTSSAVQGEIAIQIHTSNNLLGLPVGANVIVGEASSGLVGPIQGLMGGGAYGSQIGVSNLLNSGPSGWILMPCRGTNGVTSTNTQAGLTVPGVATIGTITNTVNGAVATNPITGETTSTLAGVNLLNALIKADAIKADAHASTAGSVRDFSDSGSGFTHLQVAGLPAVGDSVAPNSQYTVPGVGTLYLHRVLRTSNSLQVRMVELILGTAQGALPVGTDIRLGVAWISTS